MTTPTFSPIKTELGFPLLIFLYFDFFTLWVKWKKDFEIQDSGSQTWTSESPGGSLKQESPLPAPITTKFLIHQIWWQWGGEAES